MQRRIGYFKFILFTIFILFFQTTYAVSVDKIIVFGDSLSDTGNIYSLCLAAHKVVPIFPIIPKNPPYYEGRFSNGPVWIEGVAQGLNLPYKNYAYGGSWAETTVESHVLLPFSLAMQVNTYLVESALDFHKDKHLYVIWSGNNDYVNGRLFDSTEEATQKTVNAIQREIEWLIFYGARNFLIFNVVDLSLTPHATDMGTNFSQYIKTLSRLHNNKFNKMLAHLKENYPHAKFAFVDAAKYLDQVVATPDKYFLKNIKNACYGGGFFLKTKLMNMDEVEAAKGARMDLLNNASLRVAYLNSILSSKGQKACDHPEVYLFWDELHPTTTVHKLLAYLSLMILHENGITGKA